MRVLRSVAELDEALAPARRAGEVVGLVPTMGALHDGHLSLVRGSAARAAVTVVSVFVNPLQFAPGEDFAAYPRDLDRDVALLAPAGADLVLAPAAADLVPPGRRTTVHVAGVTDGLEGARRPGHFDGVATIVATLFLAVRPRLAFFGEKDYQQLLVVRTMVADLGFGVEVVGCPVVREPDGLAMSSRNAYLTPGQRRQATALHRALSAAAQGWGGDADRARALLRTTLADAPGIAADYAEVVDPGTLEPLRGRVDGPARAVVAAFAGTTRLLDTLALPDRS